MPKSSAATRALKEPVLSPTENVCGCADALARAAAECTRQRDRLGRYLELGCTDAEMQHIAELATLTDKHLDAMTTLYETTASGAPEAKNKEWWHAANSLWHASREYARRSAGTSHAQRLAGRHSKEKLTELAMEYELERSALLAVKQAVANYKALRTDRVSVED